MNTTNHWPQRLLGHRLAWTCALLLGWPAVPVLAAGAGHGAKNTADSGSTRTQTGPAPVLAVPGNNATLHVAIPLPAGKRAKASHRWSLLPAGRPGAGKDIPVQLGMAPAADGSVDRAAMLLTTDIPPATSAHGAHRFRLGAAGPASGPTGPFHFTPVGATGLQLRQGTAPVLVYNYGTVVGRQVPANDRRRKRSCYIHPVWGLSGEILTGDFPKDHYHHHGIFWAWPHVVVNGHEYDLWTSNGMEQKFVRWLGRETGPTAAVLGVENGWFVGPRKVMTERVWIRVFRASRKSRTVDLTLFLIPHGQAVTLRGAPNKSYGGLNMRYAARRQGTTVITVPAGRADDDLPNTPLAWADLTGTFGQTTSGAAIFVDPRDPDVPQTWLTRHYGILCVGWPGVQPKTLPADKPVRLDYRFWIHKGPASTADLKQAYEAYVLATKTAWQ